MRKSKSILKASILALSLSVSACALHQNDSLLSAEQKASLTAEGEFSIIVQINNIQCCDGVIRLALYNSELLWMGKHGIMRGRLGFILQDTQQIELHGLPSGQYAIAVFQDIDNDNHFDKWLGFLPAEPYGFSNNVGQFGPASFEKASFTLDEDKQISIELNTGI